jgi:ATP-dependent RNA helicase RhlE
MSFDTLGLSAELLRAVAEEGYDTPTPIQSQAIPVILQGKDVMAGAQTGTGKTAAFALPILQLLSENRPLGRRPRLRALVLTPTRELAAQVAESFKDYGRHLPLSTGLVFGGVGINPQIEQLRRGVDVLVATPGRLLDHASQKTVDLSGVEILVLDEGDRMLDMGFMRDIRRIIHMLPTLRQQPAVLGHVPGGDPPPGRGDDDNPVRIDIASARRSTRTWSTSSCTRWTATASAPLLSHLIRTKATGARCSCSRAPSTARTAWPTQLTRDGHCRRPRSTATRARARARWRCRTSRPAACGSLVATDLAARGLDIEQLACTW